MQRLGPHGARLPPLLEADQGQSQPRSESQTAEKVLSEKMWIQTALGIQINSISSSGEGDSWSRSYFSERYFDDVQEHASVKNIILAGALALLSIASAGAQPFATGRLPTASTTANVPTVQACEIQLRRTAELSKALAANYDAEHVREVCLDGQ